jgi:hypothetical protein
MKLNYLLFLSLYLLLPTSYAQTPQGRVEFSQGPIVSSGRVIGMGGAYIGIAEGGDVPLLNPAAFVVRYPHRQDNWFDWDFGLSWINSLPNDGIDVDQSGKDTINAVTFFELGVSAKVGRHGFGLHGAYQFYDFSVVGIQGLENLTYLQAQLGPGYAYASPRGLTIGAMLLGGRLSLSNDEGTPLSQHQGRGALFGMLYAPCGKQYRVGATARSEIESLPINSQQAALTLGLPVPEAFVVPAELGVGFSHYWGERKYNPCIPRWELGSHRGTKPAARSAPILVTTPTSQPETIPPSLPEVKLDFYRPPSRKYVLLSTDLVLTGASFSQGMQAFIAGVNQPTGNAPTVSIRAGAELEPIENKLKVRAGSYYEPSRFLSFSGRFHATTNIEYHLRSFLRREWKVSLTADVAKQYQNAGLGIGFWH